MRRDTEILLKATIKPKRDAFYSHLQKGADASVLCFWISLSKERGCIREFKINSEDICCISSPEDGSRSIPQKYQSLFDLTADFSPSETNRHGWRLPLVFFCPAACCGFDEKMLQPVQSPPTGALDSSPPPLSVFFALWSGSWIEM